MKIKTISITFINLGKFLTCIDGLTNKFIINITNTKPNIVVLVKNSLPLKLTLGINAVNNRYPNILNNKAINEEQASSLETKILLP